MTLLHVMQPSREALGISTTTALGWEIHRQEASGYLERLKNTLQSSGQLVDTRLEQGHPAERICAFAREVNADLTVLGSHGEGGVTSWNLGSTAQQVLAITRGSVLIARSSATAGNVASPKRILVPLDGSLRTECALAAAARIAETHGADLLLVHVIAEPRPSVMLRGDDDLKLARELASRIETGAKRYLADLRERLTRGVVSVRTMVLRHADKRQCLLELSRSEGIDLVVVSAHGATCNPARSFGSVTAHLMAHSNVSLLVLQDLDEREQAREDPDEHCAPPLRASYPPADS